jgi:DNA-binding NarL/FixJ family response regulator
VALKRPAEAEAVLQAAAEAARAKNAHALRWRVALSLGKLYHAQGRHEEAEEAFSCARATVERLAAGVPDAAIREHFLLRTVEMFPPARQISPRRAAKREWSGLTDREREVALLIAQGKSNREVAAALVVSERTVTTHVANILAKLGFSSRTQIASWVVEKQLRTVPQ